MSKEREREREREAMDTLLTPLFRWWLSTLHYLEMNNSGVKVMIRIDPDTKVQIVSPPGTRTIQFTNRIQTLVMSLIYSYRFGVSESDISVLSRGVGYDSTKHTATESYRSSPSTILRHNRHDLVSLTHPLWPSLDQSLPPRFQFTLFLLELFRTQLTSSFAELRDESLRAMLDAKLTQPEPLFDRSVDFDTWTRFESLVSEGYKVNVRTDICFTGVQKRRDDLVFANGAERVDRDSFQRSVVNDESGTGRFTVALSLGVAFRMRRICRRGSPNPSCKFLNVA